MVRRLRLGLGTFACAPPYAEDAPCVFMTLSDHGRVENLELGQTAPSTSDPIFPTEPSQDQCHSQSRSSHAAEQRSLFHKSLSKEQGDTCPQPGKYFRRGSWPVPALKEAWGTETAVQTPSETVQADHANNPALFSRLERAFSGIHNAFSQYEIEDAEEGARFEYRLAETRESLPDNVYESDDIREHDSTPSERVSRKAPSVHSRPDIENVTNHPLRSFRSSSTRPEPKPLPNYDKDDPYLVTFESTDSHEDNPRFWSYPYRLYILVLYATFSMIGPYASSMASPAATAIGKELGFHSSLEENLLVGLFMLSFFFGPLCSAPISEAYGRRIVLLVCSVLFIVFNIGCAVSKTEAQILVLRFFAGFFSGAIMPMGGGAVSDMFHPHERGVAMALYSISPLLGPCLAPVISGWIIQGWGEDKWPWTFWIGTIIAGIIFLVGLVLVRETYAPRILQLKARTLRKKTGDKRYHSAFELRVETVWQKIKRVFLRPIIFLFTEVLVAVPALYLSIIYACFYLCIVSLPRVFGTIYHYNIGISSLNNIAMGLGAIIFGQIGGRFVDTVYQSMCRKHGMRRPEYKLPFLMITVFILPIGMLIFGWTAEYHKVWIAPDIGLFLVGAGLIGSILQVQLYMADLMTIYAASAISATTSLRSLMAFLFLLFSNTMFDNLGVGWGLSLLSLIVAIVGIPAPFLLYKYGPQLRARSKYAVQG